MKNINQFAEPVREALRDKIRSEMSLTIVEVENDSTLIVEPTPEFESVPIDTLISIGGKLFSKREDNRLVDVEETGHITKIPRYSSFWNPHPIWYPDFHVEPGQTITTDRLEWEVNNIYGYCIMNDNNDTKYDTKFTPAPHICLVQYNLDAHKNEKNTVYVTPVKYRPEWDERPDVADLVSIWTRNFAYSAYQRLSYSVSKVHNIDKRIEKILDDTRTLGIEDSTIAGFFNSWGGLSLRDIETKLIPELKSLHDSIKEDPLVGNGDYTRRELDAVNNTDTQYEELDSIYHLGSYDFLKTCPGYSEPCNQMIRTISEVHAHAVVENCKENGLDSIPLLYTLTNPVVDYGNSGMPIGSLDESIDMTLKHLESKDNEHVFSAIRKMNDEGVLNADSKPTEDSLVQWMLSMFNHKSTISALKDYYERKTGEDIPETLYRSILKTVSALANVVIPDINNYTVDNYTAGIERLCNGGFLDKALELATTGIYPSDPAIDEYIDYRKVLSITGDMYHDSYSDPSSLVLRKYIAPPQSVIDTYPELLEELNKKIDDENGVVLDVISRALNTSKSFVQLVHDVNKELAGMNPVHNGVEANVIARLMIEFFEPETMKFFNLQTKEELDNFIDKNIEYICPCGAYTVPFVKHLFDSEAEEYYDWYTHRHYAPYLESSAELESHCHNYRPTEFFNVYQIDYLSGSTSICDSDRVHAINKNKRCNVVLHPGVTEITSSAIERSRLLRLDIPDSVTYVGNINSIRNLKEITFPNTETIFSGCIEHCPNLEVVNNQDKIIIDGDDKYGGSNTYIERCKNLKSIDLSKWKIRLRQPSNFCDPEHAYEIRCYINGSNIDDLVHKDTQLIKNDGSKEDHSYFVLHECSLCEGSHVKNLSISDGTLNVVDSVVDNLEIKNVKLSRGGDYKFGHITIVDQDGKKIDLDGSYLSVKGIAGLDTNEVLDLLIKASEYRDLSESFVSFLYKQSHARGIQDVIQDLPNIVTKYNVCGSLNIRTNYPKETIESLKEEFQNKHSGMYPKIIEAYAIVAHQGALKAETLVDEFSRKNIKALLNAHTPQVAAVMVDTLLANNEIPLYINSPHRGAIDNLLLYELTGKANIRENFHNTTQWILHHPDTSAKNIDIISTAAKRLNITEKTPIDAIMSQIDSNKALLEVKAIEDDYDDVGFKFDDTVYDLKFTYSADDKYKSYIMEPGDARMVMLGEYTHCCQHRDGAGEDAMMHGLINPNAGFWVIEDANGKIIAQAEIWETKAGELVFDNIEFADDRNIHDIEPILAKWISESDYSTIIMGLGYNAINTSGYEKAPAQMPWMTAEELYMLGGGDYDSVEEAQAALDNGFEYGDDNIGYTDADERCVYLKKDGIPARPLVSELNKIYTVNGIWDNPEVSQKKASYLKRNRPDLSEQEIEEKSFFYKTPDLDSSRNALAASITHLFKNDLNELNTDDADSVRNKLCELAGERAHRLGLDNKDIIPDYVILSVASNVNSLNKTNNSINKPESVIHNSPDEECL